MTFTTSTQRSDSIFRAVKSFNANNRRSMLLKSVSFDYTRNAGCRVRPSGVCLLSSHSRGPGGAVTPCHLLLKQRDILLREIKWERKEVMMWKGRHWPTERSRSHFKDFFQRRLQVSEYSNYSQAISVLSLGSQWKDHSCPSQTSGMLRYLYQSHKRKRLWSTEENTRKWNFLRNKPLVHSALMAEAVVAGGFHWLLSREVFGKHLLLLHNLFLITGMADHRNG